MLYNFFRVSLWIMYVCFFRRVYYLKAKNIPKNEPLIFISNHSSGFMDPILIAAMQRRPVYFWARAAEFPKNLKGWLMYKLHGLPIHRAQEGKGNMHKNEETFQKTRDLLYGGFNSAFIAPEGNCVMEKRLRPFKTGCARLAFKMMEEKNWAIDVKILPAGVNYTYHDLFRSEVYVSLGIPISVQQYKDLYHEDSAEAIKQLTQDMRVALQSEMVHVETEDIPASEKVFPLIRNSFKRNILPLYSVDDALFLKEQQVAKTISELGDNKQKELVAAVDTYHQNLEKAGASDYAVAEKNKRSFLWVLLGLPIWVIGTLFGRVPHIVARNLRNKLVPYPEFSASFAFTAAFFVWILWSLVFMIIGAFIIGWWTLLLPISMILLQTAAYHYEDYYKEWKMLTSYRRVSNKDDLKKERQAILELVK